jgi:thiamine pyrophosphate-dependent acetolactate synthase large subunit-like protein
MLDLHNPELDWVKLASGMGVEASRATSVEEFATQFASEMNHRGAHLIEVVPGARVRCANLETRRSTVAIDESSDF